jgi:hypothetical protein
VTRYAEGTTVTVESSRGEITGILAKHGVQRMGWYTEPEGDVLQFELDGGRYELRMLRPTIIEIRRDYPNARDEQAKLAGEWRRRWRANVLLLKAKLEFADGQASTVARELLAYRLLDDGRTIEQAMAAGGLPLLQPGAKR